MICPLAEILLLFLVGAILPLLFSRLPGEGAIVVTWGDEVFSGIVEEDSSAIFV